MRIASLYVTNFLGIRHAELRLRAPVALFCGANAAGKSSLRDAVALALTADLGRVGLKKEAPTLIREGADLAVCEVADADGDQRRVTINSAGKIHDSQKGRDNDPVLPYVLDAQRFGKLPLTERRAFLFGLMGVKMAPADIRVRLIDRLFGKAATTDADVARVDRIVPLLRSGFDAAAADAKTRATESKGSWRTVTGETYGSEKAKTWRAAVPAFDAARLKALGVEIEHADVAIAQWQQQIGRLQAEGQRRAALRAKLPALNDHAARIPGITTRLAVNERTLREAEEALARAQAAAGAAPRVGLIHDLARGVNDLLIYSPPESTQETDGALAALQAYKREYGPVHAAAGGDLDARVRLPALQQSRDMCSLTVVNDQRDLSAAQDARDEATRITGELAEVFDAAALAEARTQVEQLLAGRAASAAEADRLRNTKAAAEAAEAKTEQAARHAADVAAWDAIAQALSPDGIPADLLAEALGPINERLAQSAADTAWPVVTIAADMSITYGAGRPYALCSESEHWRADAMLAEAIAQVSGCRLLVLDRMDLLDLRGRSELLGWLDVLAENGEIDSALLFATLKQPPQGLGDGVQVEWIDAGVVGAHQPPKAAA